MGGSKKRRNGAKAGSNARTLASIEKVLATLLATVDDESRWKHPQSSTTIVNTLQQLYGSLQRLNDLQSSIPPPIPQRTQESFDRFSNWLSENGVDIKNAPFKIRFVTNSNKRKEATDNACLFATKYIPIDTLFLSVPAKLILSTNAAKSPGTSTISKLISSNPVFQLSPSLTLAIYLLSEALTPTSFYLPYIRILPSTFSLPLFYTLSQLLSIQPSLIFGRAIKILRNHVRYYCKLYQFIKQNQQSCKHLPLLSFTYNSFTWSVAVVMTRQNNLSTDSASPPSPKTTAKIDSSIMCLVPLWDMCNHEQGNYKITTYYDVQQEKINCFAMKDFYQGNMMTIFYGSRSNYDLFLFSGFVPPIHEINRNDLVQIILPFHNNPNHPIVLNKNTEDGDDNNKKDIGLMKLKIRLLADQKNVEVFERDQNYFCKGFVRSNGNVEDLLGIARLLFARKTDLIHMMRSKSLAEQSETSVEIKAVMLVKQCVRKARDEYSKSLDNKYTMENGTCVEIDDKDRPQAVQSLHQSEIRLLDRAFEQIEKNQARLAIRN